MLVYSTRKIFVKELAPRIFLNDAGGGGRGGGICLSFRKHIFILQPDRGLKSAFLMILLKESINQ